MPGSHAVSARADLPRSSSCSVEGGVRVEQEGEGFADEIWILLAIYD